MSASSDTTGLSIHDWSSETRTRTCSFAGRSSGPGMRFTHADTSVTSGQGVEASGIAVQEDKRAVTAQVAKTNPDLTIALTGAAIAPLAAQRPQYDLAMST